MIRLAREIEVRDVRVGDVVQIVALRGLAGEAGVSVEWLPVTVRPDDVRASRGRYVYVGLGEDRAKGPLRDFDEPTFEPLRWLEFERADDKLIVWRPAL